MELSASEQRAILERQRHEWSKIAYDRTIQIRVQQQIGGEGSALDALTADLTTATKAIDVLDGFIAHLTDQGAHTP